MAERLCSMTIKSSPKRACSPRDQFSSRLPSSTSALLSNPCQQHATARGTTPLVRARAGLLRRAWRATKRQTLRRALCGLATKSQWCRSFWRGTGSRGGCRGRHLPLEVQKGVEYETCLLRHLCKSLSSVAVSKKGPKRVDSCMILLDTCTCIYIKTLLKRTNIASS